MHTPSLIVDLNDQSREKGMSACSPLFLFFVFEFFFIKKSKNQPDDRNAAPENTLTPTIH